MRVICEIIFALKVRLQYKNHNIRGKFFSHHSKISTWKTAIDDDR